MPRGGEEEEGVGVRPKAGMGVQNVLVIVQSNMKFLIPRFYIVQKHVSHVQLDAIPQPWDDLRSTTQV